MLDFDPSVDWQDSTLSAISEVRQPSWQAGPVVDSKNRPCRIPRRIHRVWFDFSGNGTAMSDTYRENDRILKSLHPEWTFMEWDQYTAEKFVRQFYPDFWPVYRDYPKPIQRHDAIRYLLVRFGGLFIQHSFRVNKALDDLVCNHDITFSRQERSNQRVHNGFFASIANHGFWDHLMTHLNFHKKDFVLDSTGPFMLSRAIFFYNVTGTEKGEPLHILPREHIVPFDWVEKKENPTVIKYCAQNDPDACFKLFPDAFGYTPWNAAWLVQYNITSS